MEQIDKIIDILLNNFDIAYMLCVNVLTYGLIKFIDIINKEKKVKLLVKRICLLGCTLVCYAIYKLYTDIQPNILINSIVVELSDKPNK